MAAIRAYFRLIDDDNKASVVRIDYQIENNFMKCGRKIDSSNAHFI